MDIDKNLEEHRKIRQKILDSPIYLPKDYSKKGTINSSDCLASPVDGGITIRANLFGPICPERYFSSSFRVVFLLKESYITDDCYNDGDRGGHDQAKERNDNPLGDKGDKTYKKILATISALVQDEEENAFYEMKEEFFREHTCIINVNNYPAISKSSSKDYLIAKWAKKNESLISQQIRLYKPNVVIGGFTLQHFFPECCNYKRHSPENIRKSMSENNGLELLGHHIAKDNCLFMDEIYSDASYGENYAFWDDEVMFVDAYHPAYSKYCAEHIKACYDEVLNRINQKRYE